MIHQEVNGGFIFTSDRDIRQRIDVDTEFAPPGMVCICAGPVAAAQATLTLSELNELIANLKETAKYLKAENGRRVLQA